MDEPDPMDELAETRRRIARAEGELQVLRQVLRRVPHGRGDHTDFCRMENEGLPPPNDEACRCHVAMVRKCLKQEREANH
ncbi:MAG: hypothetical protein HQL91_12590 [Magnetococcales bacterium]|nr:hypothetical protein [Magnetococcales bacterium]